jgi:hypothetical protein
MCSSAPLLPVDDHRLHRRRTADVEVEDGVVTGVRVENLGDDLRIDRDGYRVLPGAIDDRGNLACSTHAACGVLVELALARCGDDGRNGGGCCHDESSFRAREKQLMVVSY